MDTTLLKTAYKEKQTSGGNKLEEILSLLDFVGLTWFIGCATERLLKLV